MEIFDILIGYVSWEGGGKKRPVLILGQRNREVVVFGITTRYEDKSETVRSKYYRINDWAQAGLERQSYVDTNNIVTLPLTSIDVTHLIGKLSITDIVNFIQFLSK